MFSKKIKTQGYTRFEGHSFDNIIKNERKNHNHEAHAERTDANAKYNQRQLNSGIFLSKTHYLLIQWTNKRVTVGIENTGPPFQTIYFHLKIRIFRVLFSRRCQLKWNKAG